MNNITIRNINVALPSGWEDLTERDIFFLAKHFPYEPTRGFIWDFFIHCLNFPANPKLSIAFAKNLHTSKKMNRQAGNLIRLFVDNKIELTDDELPEMDFFHQQLLLAIEALDNFKWLFEDFQFEKSPLPVIRHRFQKFYGPDWLLSNITGDEFDHAETFFLKFIEDKQEADLHRLIACIWRKKSSTKQPDDIREPFSEFQIENNVQKIAKWPAHKQIACMMVYVGMRNAFMGLPTSQSVFSKTKSSKKEAMANSSAWQSIMLSIATEGTFGNYKQVKNTFIHDIIAKLSLIKKEAKDVS